MKKLLVLIIILFLHQHIFAQNFPHFNASTGNYGEFPVDKDTNMYLFHGNRLVKTDKNFNTIWANTYGNLQFKNLLLSKTGSMYFIADNIIGKIESNGAISWSKDLNTIQAVINGSTFVNYTTYQLNSILLDRNNQLIVTGNITTTNSISNSAYYLKLDTLGNSIKLAPFSGYLLNNFSILNDSLGYYRFLGGQGPSNLSICTSLGFTLFNDISNSFTNGIVYTNSDTQCWESYKLVRSQFNSGFYVNLRINYNYGIFFKSSVLKCNLKGGIKWGRTFENCLNSAIQMMSYTQSMIEDNSGNLFLQVVSSNGNAYGVLKIDSNGVTNNSVLVTHTIKNSTVNPVQYCSLQKIAGENLYAQIVTTNHPISPLTINLFKSNLSSSCYSISGCNSFANSAPYSTVQTPSLQLVTSFSITSQNLTSNTATFAVNTKSCTLFSDVGLLENGAGNQITNLHPNPTSNILKFNLSNNAFIEQVSIIDVNGKVIKSLLNCSEINVSDLSQGVYFLQVKNEGLSHYSKFIKE